MKIFQIVLLSLIALLLVSCDDDDPTNPTPEELITTLTYTLSPTQGGSDVLLTFVDLDGDGGNDPVISGGTLSANSTYNGSIELLNESLDPAEDITQEVEEESLEHQFFFSTSGTNLTVAYDDEDGDGNPLGLRTVIETGDTSSGTLTVILRHEPAKDAEGVSTGLIGNAGGETDIEVSFEITVQ